MEGEARIGTAPWAAASIAFDPCLFELVRPDADDAGHEFVKIFHTQEGRSSARKHNRDRRREDNFDIPFRGKPGIYVIVSAEGADGERRRVFPLP
jgi:hypothetical protein